MECEQPRQRSTSIEIEDCLSALYGDQNCRGIDAVGRAFFDGVTRELHRGGLLSAAFP